MSFTSRVKRYCGRDIDITVMITDYQKALEKSQDKWIEAVDMKETEDYQYWFDETGHKWCALCHLGRELNLPSMCDTCPLKVYDCIANTDKRKKWPSEHDDEDLLDACLYSWDKIFWFNEHKKLTFDIFHSQSQNMLTVITWIRNKFDNQEVEWTKEEVAALAAIVDTPQTSTERTTHND